MRQANDRFLAAGALLAGWAAVALVEVPRVARGLLPREVLGGASPDAWVRITGEVSAVVVAVALLVGLRRLRNLVGGFGIIAAAGLAGAASSALWLWAPAHSEPGWWIGGPAAAAGLAVLVAPLLRERGVVGMALVAALVSAVLLPARYHAQVEQLEAGAFAAARDMVLQVGRKRLFVSVGEDVELPLRQALAASVAPPFHEQRIDLLCVEHDSDSERALREARWFGIRWGGETQVLGPLEPTRKPGPFEVQLRPLDQLGPVAVVHPADGSFVLRVITPAGSVAHRAEDPARGIRLVGPVLRRYEELVAGLSAGSLILVRVEGALSSDASDWLELRSVARDGV